MQWWGHSKEHGWVVLDRTLPTNAPGPKEHLLFFRCRDSLTYVEKRKNWNPPLYVFAPNYIRDLGPGASAEAAEAFEVLKSHWPEYQQQIQQEHRETEDRAEAVRLEAEKREKEASREKEKARRALAAIKKSAA